VSGGGGGGGNLAEIGRNETLDLSTNTEVGKNKVFQRERKVVRGASFKGKELRLS